MARHRPNQDTVVAASAVSPRRALQLRRDRAKRIMAVCAVACGIAVVVPTAAECGLEGFAAFVDRPAGVGATASGTVPAPTQGPRGGSANPSSPSATAAPETATTNPAGQSQSPEVAGSASRIPATAMPVLPAPVRPPLGGAPRAGSPPRPGAARHHGATGPVILRGPPPLRRTDRQR